MIHIIWSKELLLEMSCPIHPDQVVVEIVSNRDGWKGFQCATCLLGQFRVVG
jgi:hypothetical protein